MKTEVYSWRLSAGRKSELEEEARRRGISVSSLLEEITAQWLSDLRNGDSENDQEQAALRRRVMATVGTIRSGDPNLASRASDIVRARILRQHLQESNGRHRTD